MGIARMQISLSLLRDEVIDSVEMSPYRLCGEFESEFFF